MQTLNAEVAPIQRSRAIALSRRLLGPIWLRVGFTAVLEVPGRRTGTPHRVALFPIEVDGTWYLLSQYGVSEWVRNLRAAGRGRAAPQGPNRDIHARSRSTAPSAIA